MEPSTAKLFIESRSQHKLRLELGASSQTLSFSVEPDRLLLPCTYIKEISKHSSDSIYLAWFCYYDIDQCSISLHAKWKLQDLKRPQTLSSPLLYSPGPLAIVSMSSHYVELLRLDQIWFQIGQLCMTKASSYWPYLVESVSVQLDQLVLKCFCCLVGGRVEPEATWVLRVALSPAHIVIGGIRWENKAVWIASTKTAFLNTYTTGQRQLYCIAWTEKLQVHVSRLQMLLLLIAAKVFLKSRVVTIPMK